MNLETCKKSAKLKSIQPDIPRALKTLKLAEQRWNFINSNEIKDEFASVIVSNAYEALLETCQAVMFKEGFKSYSHECVTAFLSEHLNEKKISRIFDRYRKLRIGINYYGEDLDLETANVAIDEIGKTITLLVDKYLM